MEFVLGAWMRSFQSQSGAALQHETGGEASVSAADIPEMEFGMGPFMHGPCQHFGSSEDYAAAYEEHKAQTREESESH